MKEPAFLSLHTHYVTMADRKYYIKIDVLVTVYALNKIYKVLVKMYIAQLISEPYNKFKREHLSHMD